MLYKKNLISKEIFSICFDLYGGYISFGSINSTLHLSNITYYSYIKQNSFYSLTFKSMSINGSYKVVSEQDLNNKSNSNNSIAAILDSGSSLSYLPKMLFNKFIDKLNFYCSKIENCLADKYVTDETGICFSLKKSINFNKFIMSMPIIEFKFSNSNDNIIDSDSYQENNFIYYWKPENYLYNATTKQIDQTRDTFCIGILNWA